jgi:methyl-accepting chemotaxis protein
MSDNFEETMKNLCLPFILEQKGLINTSESNLRRLDLYEKMIDYKSEVNELNLLYNKFLNYIILIIDIVVSSVDEISSSASELNYYINEGITNFTNLVENTDTNNLHNNLITMKDSFLKLKDDINERKNNLEESINSFQKLYEKMRNELQDFQNDFNKLTENINEISNLIVEELTKENEIEIEKQSNTDFIVDSILNSLSFIYESIIKYQIKQKRD